MSTRATLDGWPLLATSEVGWALTPGTKPYQRVFDCTPEVATALAAKAEAPITFEVVTADAHLVIRNLYVLAIVPGHFPFTRGVLVTDSRYFWTRAWVAADFNRRRKTGTTRLVGEGRIENQALVNDVAYAPWSLNAGAPWKARDVLEYIFHVVEPNLVKIPENLNREVLIESFEPSDSGEFALDKILSYVGGYNVRPNADGTYTVYDTLDRSEGQMLLSAGAIAAWSGTRGNVDRSPSRPKQVRVLFERETELRFDYRETDATAPITYVRNQEPLSLENVAPNPWPTLKLASADGGKTVAQGTILEMGVLLRALEASGTRLPQSPGPLTKDVIRQFYFGPNWDYLNFLYAVDPRANGAVNPQWAAALRTIRAHFRLTFRPLPAWRDKMRSVKDYRVAVIDPATGTRAPSQAYMDYVWIPSFLGIYKRVSQGANLALQVTGYPANGGALATGQAAPGFVKIDDPDQCLMHVVLKRDPYGNTDSLAPGKADHIVTMSASEARAGGDLARVLAGSAKLTSSFGVAIVVSAVQACPNNLGRYHEEIVDPLAAKHELGQDLGACNGPEWFVLVPGTTRPARVAWLDAQAQVIKDSFYKGAAIPRNMIVNREEILSIARAEAARIYATFMDRVEGSFQVALNPSLAITGAVGHIEHLVYPDGQARSRISVLPQLQPPADMAFIPGSVQRTLRGLAQVQS